MTTIIPMSLDDYEYLYEPTRESYGVHKSNLQIKPMLSSYTTVYNFSINEAYEFRWDKYLIGNFQYGQLELSAYIQRADNVKQRFLHRVLDKGYLVCCSSRAVVSVL